ncbi:hypothetical protein [Bacillus marasmi]|uniref:hypothetical protein n=1 Tax=Bacillus marasmi TaxID=1926279 RepID=UPI0011C93917|nr:hypothetical protein [Bacillus marasmi]
MRGYLSLILGSLILAFMLAVPGNTAQAKVTAPADGECNCPVTYIVGAEGNKWVSELFKSEEFKTVKQNLTKNGYKWNGADEMSVVRVKENLGTPFDGMIMVSAAFINQDGVKEFAAFLATSKGFVFLDIQPEGDGH